MAMSLVVAATEATATRRECVDHFKRSPGLGVLVSEAARHSSTSNEGGKEHGSEEEGSEEAGSQEEGSEEEVTTSSIVF